MLASITLLPALLGLAGQRIERLRIPLAGRAAAAPRGTTEAGPHDGSPRFAAWSRRVQRHPLRASLTALALLAVLIAPLGGVRLGFPGAANDPVGTQSREANTLMTEGFGAGVAGPLQLVARIDGPQGAAPFRALGARIARDARVAAVSPIVPSRDGASA